jgi:hypothetical protein
VPLWGILPARDGQLRCECGKHCDNAGKHRRWKKSQESGSADQGQVLAWLKLYPHMNFGIVAGDRAIAADLDYRPEASKYGPAQMELLAEGYGCNIPPTVTVTSGRNDQSKHLWFQVPPAINLDTFSSHLSGVDLIKSGYCVAPGSRHLSGNYYSWAEEYNPLEQELAEVPGFLLEAFGAKSLIDVTKPEPCATIQPGKSRPDWLVLRQIRKDKVAGPLFFDGQRRHRKANGEFDRSKDDFALCCKLVFYCSHHWDQYVRLFQQSALFDQKTKQWNGGSYLTQTLVKAFQATPANWVEKSRATGAKKGRKVSPNTDAVLTIHRQYPALTASQIAAQLNLKPDLVWKILSRNRHGFYSQT